MNFISKEEFLSHHGILGMRWGIRRFQRKDGSLTPAGIKRYSDGVTFKKPKPRLEAGTSGSPENPTVTGAGRENRKTKKPNIIDVKYEDIKDKKKYISPEFEKIKNKKKYESPEFEKEEKNNSNTKKKYDSPSFEKTQDQKTATEVIKEDTKYRKAVKENYELRNNEGAKDSNKMKEASDLFKDASSGIGSISSGIDKAYSSLHNAKYGNKDRSKDVEALSNQELRQVIERIQLNQQYNRLTMPPKSKGYDRTMAALAVLGSAATVTATGLSIAAGIKKLRNG